MVSNQGVPEPVLHQSPKKATIDQDDATVNLSLWTDEQESLLLQAIMRCKPVGMHKHFRMLSIRDFMLSQGAIDAVEPHTSLNGIWQKLGTMYDLPGLDEREDSIVNDTADEDGITTEYWREFELPTEEYGDAMWQRRLDPDGTLSPERSRRGSTVPGTDEPRSSPVTGAGRSTRASGRRGGRLSKLKDEVEMEKSSRRSSKATSFVDEDTKMEDVVDEEAGDDDGDEDEDESEQEAEVEKRGTTKRGRGGRGGRRGRARGRGRRG